MLVVKFLIKFLIRFSDGRRRRGFGLVRRLQTTIRRNGPDGRQSGAGSQNRVGATRVTSRRDGRRGVLVSVGD